MMCIKHCLTLKNLPGSLSNPQVDGVNFSGPAAAPKRFLCASDEATPVSTSHDWEW